MLIWNVIALIRSFIRKIILRVKSLHRINSFNSQITSKIILKKQKKYMETNCKTVFGLNRLNHNYIDIKLQNDRYPLARSSASWMTTLKANFLLLFFIRKDFSVPPARYSTTTQQILLGMLCC